MGIPTFTQNQQIAYVELGENGRSRRYALPDMSQLVQLQNVMKQFPAVRIERFGAATIKSSPKTDSDYIGLESMPSAVDHFYDAELHGHEVIQVGPVRYSQELIDLLQTLGGVVYDVHQAQGPTMGVNTQTSLTAGQAQGTVLPVQSVNPPGVQTSESSLADQMRAQLAMQTGGQGQKSVDPPPAPPASLADQFRQQIEEKKDAGANSFLREPSLTLSIPKEAKGLPVTSQVLHEENPLNDSAEERIIQKLDEVQEIVEDIYRTSVGERISAKDLQAWFLESVKVHGWNETFERLSKEIRFVV